MADSICANSVASHPTTISSIDANVADVDPRIHPDDALDDYVCEHQLLAADPQPCSKNVWMAEI
jgi:hypothetical protein